jgi:ABC-type enterochelin transport system, periplasmic component
MKKLVSLKLTVLITLFTLALTGCSTNTPKTTEAETAAPETAAPETTTEAQTPASEAEVATTVEITDRHGTVTVPINPKTVVALDNRTYETLADWGIVLAAAPKNVMPPELSFYIDDDSVQNIGSHNEPNLEIIAAVDPELVIVGQRFGNYYEDIVALVPNAVVIDLNIDTSADAETPGENLVNGLKNATLSLGQIFEKNEEAQQLVADFDAAIENAKSAYNGTDTIMTIIVSGGDIRFAAPLSGRVWGPMYEIFDWTSSLYVDGASSDHQGDDISVEAIAQSNPDWVFVLDRDAATAAADGAVPASDVISNSPALQNITAVTNDQVVYAPNDTYTNESIQTFLELFESLANALSK